MALVGRERELGAITSALASGGLVTAWGPAGVGKSALAREALPSAPVCSLVRLAEREAILEAIARALALAGPDAASAPRVAHALVRAGPVVLDGADRALEALRELVGDWTEARILVTSRARLGVAGERAFEIAPLGEGEAAALYRALRGPPSDDAAASALLARLDGLPQAIAWIAGRAALLGDRACLTRFEARRLGDDPLTAALAISLDALAPDAAVTLERLCTFEDGAPADALEPLEHVEALVAASLARVEARAGEAPRVRAYRAVVHAVRARAERAGTFGGRVREHAGLVLAREATSADRADLEAIAGRLAHDEPAIACRALLALAPLALREGSPRACADALEAVLPSLAAPLADDARLALARMRRRLGELEAARAHLDAMTEARVEAGIERAHLDRQASRTEAALAGYALAGELALGDPALAAVARGELGRMLQSVGRAGEAVGHHAEAIALSRAAGRQEREALERSLHARAVHRAGRPREAIPLHESALALHGRRGDRRLAAAERGHLAYCHHELGELGRAELLYREAIEGLADAGDVVLEHVDRVLLARVLGDAGRVAEARLELALARGLGSRLLLPRLARTGWLVAGQLDAEDGRIEEAIACWRAGAAIAAHAEVGFEALLDAWLGWAERDPARTASAPVPEHPGLALARAVLVAAASDEPPPEVDPALAATCRELRRAVALNARGSQRVLSVSADASRARGPDGAAIDLTRRGAPRRILAALCEAHRARPGASVERQALIEAGWPGERMRTDAADKRLRTAIWTLRKAGLEPVLLTRDDGYLLDPAIAVRID